jgi:hypothetical protein
MLVRCLRPPLSKEGAFAIMQGFSFEWVAEKARAPRSASAPRAAPRGDTCHLVTCRLDLDTCRSRQGGTCR